MGTTTCRRSGPTKVHDKAENSQVQHAGNQARESQVEQAADQAQDSQVDHSNQEILQINDAIISAIEFGTWRLQELRDSTAEPYTDERDADMEDLILHPLDMSSLRDPSVNSTNDLEDRLQRINRAILQHNTEPPPPPEEPKVFYRVTTPESHTSYDYRLGFWSARGLPDHDFEEPLSEDEFCEHIKDTRFKSPYISMTSEPGRACQYGHFDGQLVYEIDAAKLRQMGVHFESTTAIAKRYGIKITGPGRLDFRKSCVEAGYVDRKTHEMVEPEDVPAGAREKLAALLHPKGIAQKFADESDDESAAARENASPIQTPPPATDPTLLQSIKDLRLSDS
ncbi:hypothetical protein O988_05660 [Pseudogymnoascus sp. VKM F-3808]|nr:hypothetical protein O988_05660 [Pseudogymnoascus sp. VKM F-3808]